MTETPTSKYYIFIELISENNFTQSWLATEIATGKKCFIKIPLSNAAKDLGSLNAILRTAYICQTKIYSDGILRPIARRKENGKILLEYDYLDQTHYIPLSVENFFEGFIQVCLLTDFLHISGFTHRDLKLDNFRFTNGKSRLQPLLLDLETLAEIDTSTKATIIGTKPFIAPEVQVESTYTAQSDVYSLGKSLEFWLNENRPQLDKLSAGEKKKFKALDNLTAEMVLKEPEYRPTYLLDALLKEKLINAAEHDELNRKLLVRRLQSYYKNLKLPPRPRLNYIKSHLEENLRIFGIQAELVADLLSSYRRDRNAALSLIKKIIRESEIIRREDFWYIQISDSLLRRLYIELNKILKLDLFPKDTANLTARSGNINKLVMRAEDHKRDKYHLKSNLILKHIIGKAPDEIPFVSDTRRNIQKMLISNSLFLGLVSDVTGYYQELLENTEKFSDTYFEILHDLIFHHLTFGDAEEAHNLSDMAISELSASNSELITNRHLRLKTWFASNEQDYENAIVELEKIIEYCIQNSEYQLLIESYNYLGVVYWRMGKYDKARKLLIKGLNSANKHRLQKASMSVLSNLAVLSYEYSEFDKSINYARRALRYVENSDDYFFTGYLNLRLVNANLRNADYKEAYKDNQRYISATINANQLQLIIGLYYFLDGFIKNNSSNFRSAVSSLQIAQKILSPLGNIQPLGNCYYNKAEIALFRGDQTAFDEAIAKARKIFRELDKPVILLELDYFEKLFDLINKDEEVNLAPYFNRLYENRSYFVAVQCLFYMIVTKHSPSEELKACLDKVRTILKNSEKVPVFEAVQLLREYHFGNSEEEKERPQLLKNAYNALIKGFQALPAMLMAQEIGEYYNKIKQMRLARKFFEEAQKNAEKLGNERHMSTIEGMLTEVNQFDSSNAVLIEVLQTLSDLILNIDKREDILQKLIEFAVASTSAERGVLLLRPDSRSEFKIKSYYNCDSDSLEDIHNYSQTVPEYVGINLEPLLIEDAINDKRTKELKSIVMHQIRSILCLPIYSEGEAIGVLYLDHHSIPTLFTREDVRLAQAMGKAICSILKTTLNFRTLSLTKAESSGDEDPRNLFVTKNKIMKELLEMLPDIARTNTGIIIHGESGTGKDVLANIIHRLSLRKNGPFVPLNCAAIPDSMIEAELFGIEKNAATGVDGREGKLYYADEGTLFLDEIGDLSTTVQPKLLRVIEEQQFQKVGGHKTIYVDIRYICATNKKLEDMIKQDKFRQDLFYRLNTFMLEIPPLRERRDDIPLLINHFIEQNVKKGKIRPRITSQAMDILCRYNWPGNVRELKNIVERLCILHGGQEITSRHLPREIIGSTRPKTKEEVRRQERDKMKALMIEHNCNKTRAAEAMDMPLTTFCRKLKKYNLENLDYCQ